MSCSNLAPIEGNAIANPIWTHRGFNDPTSGVISIDNTHPLPSHNDIATITSDHHHDHNNNEDENNGIEPSNPANPQRANLPNLPRAARPDSLFSLHQRFGQANMIDQRGEGRPGSIKFVAQSTEPRLYSLRGRRVDQQAGGQSNRIASHRIQLIELLLLNDSAQYGC